ncbi:MAG: HEAT repeat domain-containing protein [Pseudomonadota bacterium]
MKLIHTTLLALLMAGATCAQAANDDQSQRTDRAPTDDESLAIAALEGLMAQPPDRALPILKKVLSGSQPPVVKKRAMFVLSQIDAPEARDILMQTARSPNSELRGEAIRSIGIGGNPTALDALQEIYKAGSADVKRDILKAWMIAGRNEPVFQAALNAKTEEEASEAIRTLGVMGAREELRKLGDRPETMNGLAQAFAISGDLAGLRKIAEGKGKKEVRIDAVRNIGIIQGDAARAALREIYARETDAEIKDAALHGMLIAQDDQGVLALYRAAKTIDEKRSLMHMLSMMNGDVALEAIDAALEKK